MKILQVVHGFPPQQRAGTEMLTYNLSKEIAKRHEVHVLYPAYKKSRRSHCYVNSFQREGIKIHELVIEKNLWNRICNLLQLKPYTLSNRNKDVEEKFKELLYKISPDIIHFQHLIGLSLLLPLLAKKRSVIILNLNDYWLICPTTHFLRTDGKICDKPSSENCLKCFSKAIKLDFRRPHTFLYYLINKVFGRIYETQIVNRARYVKQAINSADKLIAPSKFLVKKFIEYGFIQDKDLEEGKLVILCHGIDASRLREVRKICSDKIRFGFVGALSPRKGVHILIDAFKKLEGLNAELKIYGKLDPTDEYHRCLLKKSKNRLNVKFMGTFNDVREPYSNIDVLVVPSITYEGYGLVVQEAFFTKTPVIASDIGALNEFVEHMKNGLLFKVGDANDLAMKIYAIIENSHLLGQLRGDIPIVKTVEQQAKEIERIYERTISLYSGDAKNAFG